MPITGYVWICAQMPSCSGRPRGGGGGSRDGPQICSPEDSEAYPNGHGRAPDPVVTSAQELVRGLHANQLVQLDVSAR